MKRLEQQSNSPDFPSQRDLKTINSYGINSKTFRSTNILQLESRVYDIFPDHLSESFRHISNIGAGLNRIFCDLTGSDSVVIDGNGSELRCHGRLIPFYFFNCKNVTIRNFKIDWERPFMSEGKILEVHDDFIDLQFPATQPVMVKHGKLVFYGDNYESDALNNMLEFCSKKMEPAYHAYDNYGLFNDYRAEMLDTNIVRVFVQCNTKPKVGNIMVFLHEFGLSPAIVIDNCENVKLENIDIYHCGGKAILAQNSRDVYLKHVNILPRKSLNRVFSTLADASHFVDCEGDIFIKDCSFTNQLDDSVNIHGIYRPVIKLLDDKTIGIGLIHCKQLGIDTIQAGDKVGFYDQKTYQLKYEGFAKNINRINCEYTEVKFNKSLPKFDWNNIAVMKQCRDVNVEIENCYFSNNRARGILISTLGKVIIENNYFHTSDAAIRISGDMNNWFESGPVEDVEIKNNVFENCNFGSPGALIDIVPEVKGEFREFPVHSNVKIHNNKIKYIQKPLVRAWCVENLEFYDNEFMESSDYPQSGQDKELLEFGKAVTTGTISLPCHQQNNKP